MLSNNEELSYCFVAVSATNGEEDLLGVPILNGDSVATEAQGGNMCWVRLIPDIPGPVVVRKTSDAVRFVRLKLLASRCFASKYRELVVDDNETRLNARGDGSACDVDDPPFQVVDVDGN